MAGGPNKSKSGSMPATKGERRAQPVEGAKAAAAAPSLGERHASTVRAHAAASKELAAAAAAPTLQRVPKEHTTPANQNRSKPIKATGLNVYVLKDLVKRADAGKDISRLDASEMPHARRLLKMGALAANKGRVEITAAGRALAAS